MSSFINTRRAVLAAIAATGLAGLAPAGAQAQATATPAIAWPSQITIVVPFPPGASNDTFARIIAQKLGPRLGVSVIVDNKPGASGNIGAGFVSRAQPNGATLLLTSSSFPASAAIAPNLPFDPLTGLTPVAQLAKGPMIVAVGPESPYRSLAELLAAAKDKGKVTFGTAGVGSINQMANEMLAQMAKVEMTHVSYRGIGPAITDLMSGQIQMTIASFPSIHGQVKAGKVRALAVTSPARSPFAPDLPPVAQTVPGYSVELWWGIYAPGGMAAGMIEALNREIGAIVAEKEMQDRFAQEGAVASALSAAEFAKITANDLATWRAIAKERNIKAE